MPDERPDPIDSAIATLTTAAARLRVMERAVRELTVTAPELPVLASEHGVASWDDLVRGFGENAGVVEETVTDLLGEYRRPRPADPAAFPARRHDYLSYRLAQILQEITPAKIVATGGTLVEVWSTAHNSTSDDLEALRDRLGARLPAVLDRLCALATALCAPGLEIAADHNGLRMEPYDWNPRRVTDFRATVAAIAADASI